MSEIHNKQCIRWHLLTSVSALALILSSPDASAGNDGDRSQLWIELGGDLDVLSGLDDRFAPPFALQTPTPTPFLGAGSLLSIQRASRYAFAGEGSLSFQPDDSNWVFSATIRYGRSNNKRDVHRQTAVHNTYPEPHHVLYEEFFPGVPNKWPAYKYETAYKFSDSKVVQSEGHMVLDFEAGKDVGLGMLGHGGTSVLSGGVRMVRFTSHDDVTLRARPNMDFYAVTNSFFHVVLTSPPTFNTYYMHGIADRSFKGVGPSLSWKASLPVAGNVQDGQLELDWSINGAVLFGRQKAKVRHQTTARNYHKVHYDYISTSAYPSRGYVKTYYSTLYKHNPGQRNRSRRATVPNFGSSIGLSYRIANTKLSLGYRADYFFGAMDGGIDAAQKTTLGFNGLYASISIGLGD